MSNRPTAYELGQEYAKLEKAYAEADADCTHAMQQMVAALSNSNFYYIDEKGQGEISLEMVRGGVMSAQDTPQDIVQTRLGGVVMKKKTSISIGSRKLKPDSK